MSVVAELTLLALALPAVASCAYLVLLTILSARLAPAQRSSRELRFDVIVPAHDEAAVIERCLASLARLDWPADRHRIVVVADNCADTTPALAAAAGAHVLERRNTALRGKGYALQFAFDWSRESGVADAVVVVDADSEVSPNLLEAFAARIALGAGAVQAHYGVLNPEESWRTRLLAIAHGAFHTLRSRARERMRLSCGLRGNGWCVTHRVLREVPYRAFSLAEDIEYGIELALAGYRVHYADEAHANAEMASAETVARGQRQRWESGRFQLIRQKVLPLLRSALNSRSLVPLDLALDLLVLPLSYLALNVAAMMAGALALFLWSGSQGAWPWWLWSGALSSLGLLCYVLRGWQLSGLGASGLVDLLRAPRFILWRAFTLLRGNDKRGWVSTRRKER